MHFVASNYPEAPTASDREDYRAWLFYEAKVLPCASCRASFQKRIKNLKATDHYFDNQKTFFAFVWALHDDVSRSKGKAARLVSLQNAERYYENFRAGMPKAGCKVVFTLID